MTLFTRKIFRFILAAFALGLSLHLASCRLSGSRESRELAVYPGHIEGAPDVRVRVANRESECTLSVDGKYEIRAVPDAEAGPLSPPNTTGPVTVTINPTVSGLKLGQSVAPYAKVMIVPLDGSVLTLNGSEYDCPLTFIRVISTDANAEQKMYLQVVANVNLEQYLIGVTPGEMPSYWPIEALRSQCVASRTFALYKILTRQKYDYDVLPDARSQVWHRHIKNNPVINMVVNSTRGVVMTDSYRLFPAYFSAQCGGATKDGVSVFVSRHIAPLSAVSCPHCGNKEKTLYSWSSKITTADLQRRLKESGRNVGTIRRVRALDEKHLPLSEIGSVYDIQIDHEGPGGYLTLPALRFRSLFGASVIKSTWFEIKNENGSFTITGRGSGHGVGLCQYGARTMALQGKDYRDILSHFYTGHRLVRLW